MDYFDRLLLARQTLSGLELITKCLKFIRLISIFGDLYRFVMISRYYLDSWHENSFN